MLRLHISVPRFSTPCVFAAIAVLAAALLTTSPPACASDFDGRQSQSDALTWLKSGNYDALDRRLSSLESRYESGTASEDDLYWGFRALYEDGIDNSVYFDRWLRAFPNSYAARLARGIYWYRVGCCWRGNRPILMRTDADLEQAAKYLPTARSDLMRSLRMTAKPYLSAYYLLNVALLDSTPGVRRRWLIAGTQLAPGNVRLRLRYMDGLSPEWGGSIEQMRDFRSEVARAHAPDRLLAELDVKLHTETARSLRKSGTPQQLFDEWRQVLERVPAAGETPDAEALIGYAYSAWHLGKRAEADNALARLATMPINDGWILSIMGYIYTAEERMPAAWAVLQRAATLNDPWAQLAVGKTMYFGCVDVDLAADREGGLVWVRRSAAQGFTEAKEFLEETHFERAMNETVARIRQHLQ